MERVKRIGKKIAGYVISGATGSGIGYLVGLYGKIQADANVAVRPELAKVDWITALLSGHFTD